MFGKKGNSGPTVIGKGATVEGTVQVTGGIQVDGCVDGQVRAVGEVSIGPEGVVSGEVHGDDVTIGGRVEGTVCARGHLHMLPSGRVEGDVHYQTLQVDRGANIEGRTMAIQDRPANDTAREAPPLPSDASEPAHA